MAAQRRAQERDGNGGGRIGWLIPLVVGLLIGLALGLVYAWQINPAIPSFAYPNELRAGDQTEWIEMVADSYAHDQDLQQAAERLTYFSQEELVTTLTQLITTAQSEGDLAREQRLQALLAQVQSQSLGGVGSNEGDAGSGAGLSQNAGLIAQACGFGLLVLVLLAAIAVVVTRLRRTPDADRTTSREPRPPRTPRQRGEEPSQPTAAEVIEGQFSNATAEVDTRDTPGVRSTDTTDQAFHVEQPHPYEDDEDVDIDALLRDTEDDFLPPTEEGPRRERRESADSEPSYSPAFSTYTARYAHGEPIFSTSFPIETDKLEDLGECGVGVLEWVDDVEPQQATVFELWLFDRDSLMNSTAVLLNEALWQDESQRERLRPKGEPRLVRTGDTFHLDSESLRVEVRVRNVEYGDTAEADGAYFENLELELTAQQKSEA